MCFVHNMLCSDNSVIVTVMRLFMQSNVLCQTVSICCFLYKTSRQPEIYFSLCVGLTVCTFLRLLTV